MPACFTARMQKSPSLSLDTGGLEINVQEVGALAG